MSQYFIHNGQSEEGPFSLEELKSKSINPDTPVWYDGIEGWTTAEKIDELKSFFTKKSAPPPFTKSETSINESPKDIQSQYLFSEENSSKKKPQFWILAISGIVVISLIVWLVYRNNQNSDTINNLQDQVTTQNQEIQDQNNEQAQKEAERQRINAANTAKNMNFRNNWQNYIKAENSEPSIDYTLGGISEFNLLVTNTTSYMLDEVQIEVLYIRKNGSLAQTKTVSITNIPANSSGNAIAPSSINGVKISYSISKIVSKKMHFCYPENNGNSADPYFCK